eukprot:2875966-Rhodomonas_salina.1
MANAVAALPVKADFALIDGNRSPEGLTVPGELVIKGDAKCTSIAAASIVAKVRPAASIVATVDSGHVTPYLLMSDLLFLVSLSAVLFVVGGVHTLYSWVPCVSWTVTREFMGVGHEGEYGCSLACMGLGHEGPADAPVPRAGARILYRPTHPYCTCGTDLASRANIVSGTDIAYRATTDSGPSTISLRYLIHSLRSYAMFGTDMSYAMSGTAQGLRYSRTYGSDTRPWS